MKKVCVNLWHVVPHHFQGIRNENTLVYLWSSNQIVFVWKKRKDQIAPNKMLVNRLSYQCQRHHGPRDPHSYQGFHCRFYCRIVYSTLTRLVKELTVIYWVGFEMTQKFKRLMISVPRGARQGTVTKSRRPDFLRFYCRKAYQCLKVQNV